MSARIGDVAVIPYALPMARPWRTARGTITRRDGWLLRLAAGNVLGLGDCAPLPEAGTEAPEMARDALLAAAARLTGTEPEEALAGLVMPGTPAARCAVETALLALLSGLDGVPVATRLGSRARRRVRVGTACERSDDALRAAAAAGFTVIKLKVGLGPADAEAALLRGLRVPDGQRLRLDANGAFEGQEAVAFLDGIAGLPIESVEEPLRGSDAHGLAALQERVPFPLALDESLPDLLARDEGWPVRRIVVKPTVLGGPLVAARIARRAEAAGIEVVATSALESSVGIAAAAQLAAVLDGDLAHGLDTACWLAQDLAPPLAITEGWAAVPGMAA